MVGFFLGAYFNNTLIRKTGFSNQGGRKGPALTMQTVCTVYRENVNSAKRVISVFSLFVFYSFYQHLALHTVHILCEIFTFLLQKCGEEPPKTERLIDCEPSLYFAISGPGMADSSFWPFIFH